MPVDRYYYRNIQEQREQPSYKRVVIEKEPQETPPDLLVAYVESIRGGNEQKLEEFRAGYKSKRDAWNNSSASTRPSTRERILAKFRQGRQPSKA